MAKKLHFVFAALIVLSLMLASCGPAATETPAPAEPTTVVEEPTEAPVEPTAAPTEVVTEAPTEPPAEPTEAATEPPAASGEGFLACQVTDVGGIDDKSFNATAWQGFLTAEEELGVEVQYLESQQQADYERNINEFIESGCDLIVTVGFLLGDATQAAAEANPEQNFAIVDYGYDPVIPNVLALTFATDEAGFLAGYAAAAVSQTGIVGTFGGLQIPTVTIFMDGFYYGVQYYNEQKGADVQVLGWDPAAQTGTFVGNFESLDDGRLTATALMDEGADVIMPVAGPVGLGAAAAIQEAGNAYVIGVDTDWTVSAEEYADVTLTSVMKRMEVATFEAIQSVVEGTFEGGFYTGTLENEGVGIAPLHGDAPAELQAEIDEIAAGIIAGEITVGAAE